MTLTYESDLDILKARYSEGVPHYTCVPKMKFLGPVGQGFQ